MKRQTPIPEELWDQCPPAAQAAILGLILQYEQELRAAHSGPAPAGGPPPVPGAGVPVKPPADAAMADLIGKTFSHFEIGPLLAAGNTGGIFRAKDTTKPYRAVAMQVLRPEVCGEDQKERFAK